MVTPYKTRRIDLEICLMYSLLNLIVLLSYEFIVMSNCIQRAGRLCFKNYNISKYLLYLLYLLYRYKLSNICIWIRSYYHYTFGRYREFAILHLSSSEPHATEERDPTLV